MGGGGPEVAAGIGIGIGIGIGTGTGITPDGADRRWHQGSMREGLARSR